MDLVRLSRDQEEGGWRVAGLATELTKEGGGGLGNSSTWTRVMDFSQDVLTKRGFSEHDKRNARGGAMRSDTLLRLTY